MIADFTWPVVQEGWLECDGSDVNTTTYGALYDVMTIQMTGTRINGNNTITSLTSTANMRVGYYIFGTGIPTGTTITVINSGSQVTMSNNATSAGTTTVVVSPWLLNNGTIRLPDLSAAGRFRRSRDRSVGTSVGQLQESQNLSHVHSVVGNTGAESAVHTHFGAGTTGGMNASNPHAHTYNQMNISGTAGGSSDFNRYSPGAAATSAVDINHGHDYSFNTGGQSVNHTHPISFNTGATGDATEARPRAIVVMTCVKI